MFVSYSAFDRIGSSALSATAMENTNDRDSNVRYMVQFVASEEKAILKWNRWIDALDAILSPQEEKTDE